MILSMGRRGTEKENCKFLPLGNDFELWNATFSKILDILGQGRLTFPKSSEDIAQIAESPSATEAKAVQGRKISMRHSSLDELSTYVG